MKRPFTWCRAVVLSCLLGIATLTVLAQDKPASHKKWTFEEAKMLLERSPRDAYLQYVVLQTAQREKKGPDQLYFLNMLNRTPGRRVGVDLFNTFSGALAVQESLQLDTMLDGQGPGNWTIVRPGVEVPAKEKETGQHKKPDDKVKVTSIEGPTIQSHPWEKMLAGRKAEIGTLANCVPEDFYFIEFGSAAKLVDALATTNLWAGHLFAQMLGSAGSQDVEKRIKTQLGIQGIPPGLLDAVGLKGIALTGSDLYVADGSDVTLLVQGERLVQLRQWIDGALGKKAGVQRRTDKYLDYEYTLSESDDQSVHVYAADPRPDLHVRSNSLPAFQKVLAAIAGKNEKGETCKRLGESTEFAYIRTVLPRNAGDEDGLVYLSDPCIRRLLGPRVKLTQQQRLRAFNHLKMIERAALMYRTENGHAPKSFEELAQSGCAPGVFGEGKWACPAGGKYTLSKDGMSASSTVFGSCGHLTPLVEIPLENVSQTDADAYKQFLQAYNQYWRTFFDPIAVRIKVSPERFQLETVVLPLIDNSIYTGMAEAVGGPTVPLATLPVPPKTIHSVTAHINKSPILKMLPDENGDVKTSSFETEQHLRQIMIAGHNYHNDYNRLPGRAIRSKDGKPLLSWRVMLLPYLEQDQLFKQFKLDEPWDSEHNKKLIAQMPRIYSSGDAALDKEHKTRLVVPVGEKTLFPPKDEKITLGAVTVANGTSNTIAYVEASSEKAVIWSKPDDWEVNWNDPKQGLFGTDLEEAMIVACDAAVYRLKSNIDAKTLGMLLQWKGGDGRTNLNAVGQPNRMSRGPLSEIPNLNLKLLRQFVEKGIGEQISYQVFDAGQPISSEVSSFIGSRSPLGEMGPVGFGSEMVIIGLFAQSLTNPVCASLPVNNTGVVDRFLEEVDQRLAELPKSFDQWIRTEKYHIKLGEKTVRVFAVKVMGITFRLAWARMGNWLVMTNQPAMLEELAAFYSGLPAQVAAAAEKPTADHGHAQFRVRPEAWNAVLPGYRLGWEENHRTSCEFNQQQLMNLARAYPELVNQDGTVKPELLQHIFRIYGVRPYCPDDGVYRIAKQGLCECSVHGQAHVNPRQLLGPAPSSETMKSLEQFKGMSATLTFLEDGLHAVVTIQRK